MNTNLEKFLRQRLLIDSNDIVTTGLEELISVIEFYNNEVIVSEGKKCDVGYSSNSDCVRNYNSCAECEFYK